MHTPQPMHRSRSTWKRQCNGAIFGGATLDWASWISIRFTFPPAEKTAGAGRSCLVHPGLAFKDRKTALKQ